MKKRTMSEAAEPRVLTITPEQSALLASAQVAMAAAQRQRDTILAVVLAGHGIVGPTNVNFDPNARTLTLMPIPADA